MLRYYARLNPEKVDESFLNREEVMRVSDVGAQLGFGLSVLDERGLLRADRGAFEPKHACPLLTWPFLDLLESLELSRCSLLELGSGNSTLWFGNRFERVRSFETDERWQRALAPHLQTNISLELVSLEQLERGALAYLDETFVLVDFAGHRTRFLRHFLAQLGERRPNAIILDNADWYRNGARLLARHGYRELPFHGFKSGQSFISCTSLFVHEQSALPQVKEGFYRPEFARRFDNAWDAP